MKALTSLNRVALYGGAHPSPTLFCHQLCANTADASSVASNDPRQQTEEEEEEAGEMKDTIGHLRLAREMYINMHCNHCGSNNDIIKRQKTCSVCGQQLTEGGGGR